jgi:hypothetical protein
MTDAKASPMRMLSMAQQNKPEGIQALIDGGGAFY